MPLIEQELVAFGPYLLDLKRRVLKCDNRPVSLPPKDLDTLIVLVQHAGQLVEKQALMEMVWPGTFVEEANISRHIFNIRQVLEAADASIEYIKTVPKRGYCFVAPIRWLEDTRWSDISINKTPVLEPAESFSAPLPALNNEKSEIFVDPRQVSTHIGPSAGFPLSAKILSTLIGLALIVGIVIACLLYTSPSPRD